MRPHEKAEQETPRGGKVLSRHQGHQIGHGLRLSQRKEEEVAVAAGNGRGFNSDPCVTVAI